MVKLVGDFRKMVEEAKSLKEKQISDYVNGFQKLLLTMSKSDDATELQKLLNDYVDLVKKTKIANDVINKEKEKI